MRGVHWIGAAIVVAFGCVRAPIEHSLTTRHQEERFRGAKFDLELRERLTQTGFIAALSGYRSLVAEMLWIEAFTAWTRTDWAKMALLFDNVTTLQPRETMYWDMSAWHMAWNASVAAIDNPKEPNMALRRKAQREYFDLGRDFLERGLRNNPDRPELYERLADLYRQKYEDPCRASEYYRKASEFPGAYAYSKRFAVYEMARCPGREKEAYAELVRIYNLGEKERLPTLLSLLGELEEKLQIPAGQRLGKNIQ